MNSKAGLSNTLAHYRVCGGSQRKGLSETAAASVSSRNRRRQVASIHPDAAAAATEGLSRQIEPSDSQAALTNRIWRRVRVRVNMHFRSDAVGWMTMYDKIGIVETRGSFTLKSYVSRASSLNRFHFLIILVLHTITRGE